MEHKWLRKITALLLTLALSVQLASPAFAAVVQEENGNFSIVDANGNVIDSKSQKEWEEAYPYGVFAFKETQVNLKEGSADGQEKGTLTLYRLGGQVCRNRPHSPDARKRGIAVCDRREL